MAILLVAGYERGRLGTMDCPQLFKDLVLYVGPGIASIICLLLFRKSHHKTISFFGSSAQKSIAFYVVPIIALAMVGVQGQGMNPHLFPFVFGLLGFVSILGEELGWRNFLQDALRPLPELWKYMLIGVMWELWHFTNRMGHGELVQIVIRVSIWIAALVLLSFIMGRATDRSKSVIVAVTLHSWIDILAEFNQTATYVVFGLAIPFWVYLLWQWKSKNYRQQNIAESRAEVTP